MSKKESLDTKFQILLDKEKRAIRAASMKFVTDAQEAVRVLKIMIFLHSTQDFESILRLYGKEGSWGAE